jgi:hypothetical protein
MQKCGGKSAISVRIVIGGIPGFARTSASRSDRLKFGTKRKLRRSNHPSALQKRIVDVLQAQAGDFLEDIDLFQHLLQVHHPDLERPLLLLDHLPYGSCRGAVAPARVKVDEVEPLHSVRLCHGAGMIAGM